MKNILANILSFLSYGSVVIGSFIGGSVYLVKAFIAMSNIVGFGWAFVWTFPMPLGVATFPFWAREIYGYSDSSIWFWYWWPFIGIGLFFVFSFIAVIFNDEI